MNGELRVVENVPEAFASLVCEAYADRPGDPFSLVLSGGSAARECYEALASRELINWMSVDIYWGDERCVPPDSPDSNERLGREALLQRVGGVNSVHPMRCEEGADAYQLKIGHLPFFDVVHLGMGPDGHTASLFPGSPALEADPGRLVVPNHDPSGRNRLPRMTLTYSGIGMGRRVVFTVAGEGKREALRRVIAGEDLPAARVRAAEVIWLVDSQALPD